MTFPSDSTKPPAPHRYGYGDDYDSDAPMLLSCDFMDFHLPSAVWGQVDRPEQSGNPPPPEGLRTRDHLSDFMAGVDAYAHVFRELRAALPPEQAEAVEAILMGPFYDGPHSPDAAAQPRPPRSPRRQHKPRNPPLDGLLTPAEAARKLGCSIKTLNGHVRAGALRYVAVGHGKKRLRRMFTDADLDEFVANQARKDVPCPSTRTRARRTGNMTSGGDVVAFTGVPRPGLSGTRKK